MSKRADPEAAKDGKSAKQAAKDAIAEAQQDADPILENELELKAEAEISTDEATDDDTNFDDAADDVMVQDEFQPAEPETSELSDRHHVPEYVVEEPAHRSLAATALMVLIGILVVASLTLWAAPKLAPHLPASLAQYLLPGQMEAESRLAELDSAIAAETAKNNDAIAALNVEISDLSDRVSSAADSSQTEAAIANAQSAADAASALSARVDKIEADLTSLRAEFGAVSSALADAGSGTGPASPEIAAAVAALGSRVDGLAKSLDSETAALSDRLDAVESSAAERQEVQKQTLGEASAAIRTAKLQAAFELLASQLAVGAPYREKLNEISDLTGFAPPEVLSASADSGVATATDLDFNYGRHAQAAVAADIQASAGDGSGQQALAWLRAQVAGRPTDEVAGDSVEAITSRIAARVEEGKLAEALSEAEALPAHAQTGLGGWLDQLRARVAADKALDDWRGKSAAGG